MHFRTAGYAVLAAVKLASLTKLNAKFDQFLKETMDKHYGLAILAQKLFVDRYPFLCKPAICLHIAKVLVGIVYACGRVVSIVAPQSPRASMDIRIWAYGLDPQFYIVEYARTAYPFLFVLGRAMTLNNPLIFKVLLSVGRFFTMTAALYEFERVMTILIGAVYTAINIDTTTVNLLTKIVTLNRQRIQGGQFHSHIMYYVMIQVAVQAVEDSLKVTLVMLIFVATVTLVTITFISVRLGHFLHGSLLVGLVSAGGFAFMLAKTILSRTGGAFKNSRLLKSVKELHLLVGMRRGVKHVYLRNVGRLSVVKIPIGVGYAVFTTINGSLNVSLSSLLAELCVNTLILF
ncbi:hypothetical protein Fcan01_15400 [Folsomia candida]|uniref:Uncharacterized protein n=1 Tax=Folsomia candida TaxID=158441 RepID=A0A226DWJ0_FOLCA|nr:hypothetical protein Fcan01_15400 [Folsomia candida]